MRFSSESATYSGLRESTESVVVAAHGRQRTVHADRAVARIRHDGRVVGQRRETIRVGADSLACGYVADRKDAATVQCETNPRTLPTATAFTRDVRGSRVVASIANQPTVFDVLPSQTWMIARTADDAGVHETEHTAQCHRAGGCRGVDERRAPSLSQLRRPKKTPTIAGRGPVSCCEVAQRTRSIALHVTCRTHPGFPRRPFRCPCQRP